MATFSRRELALEALLVARPVDQPRDQREAKEARQQVKPRRIKLDAARPIHATIGDGGGNIEEYDCQATALPESHVDSAGNGGELDHALLVTSKEQDLPFFLVPQQQSQRSQRH